MQQGNGAGPLFQDYEGCDYEQFWKGPGKEYLDKLERLIVHNGLPGGDLIVEVGAGFGRLGRCYTGKYRSVHMVEPASNLRAAAAGIYGASVEYHDASVYSLPFPSSSFDGVLMVRVFHHLGDSRMALKELRRIMKPGATLVFNYSNKRNIKHIVKFLAGRATNPFSQSVDHYTPTLMGHHPRHVSALVAEAGFRTTAEYGAGVFDKAVNLCPWLLKTGNPSLGVARLLGWLRVAPVQFIVAVAR